MSNMIKIKRSNKRRHGSGGFGIEILWPGILQPSNDSGIGGIGRIDHASITPGTVISMHPHKNDEILTYIRQGKMLHLDTVGNKEEISNTRLMLMNAGHTFQHEERILGEEGESLQCLQIFVRPTESELTPQVQFHDFDVPHSQGAWQLIAGPEEAPLIFRSQTWLHDVRLIKNEEILLPVIPVKGVSRILYIFEGNAKIGNFTLESGESIIINDDMAHTVKVEQDTDLVLFTTNPHAKFFRNGMFSGNVR